MSAVPLASLESLTTEIQSAWQPPQPWEELTCDRDRRAWIEALVAHDLLPKATSAVTCQQFFRKILEYSVHWTLVGKTTCHLATCRNCGTGKMRVHRLRMTDPDRYSHIVSECTRTLRLTITYSTPAATLDEYRARAVAGRAQLALLWRRLNRSFRDVGMIPSFEPDPRRRDIHFRVYIVGSDPRHWWFAREWQRIVGMQAEVTSRSSWTCAADAFKWTLSALEQLLMLDGPERAEWERAFDSFRFTSSLGTLRGARLEDAMESDIGKSSDPDAPYGRCPCGCGGAIVKSDQHAPMTLSQLTAKYTHVEFGPLRDYTAYSSKVNARPDLAYQNCPTAIAVAPSPPPW